MAVDGLIDPQTVKVCVEQQAGGQAKPVGRETIISFLTDHKEANNNFAP